MLGKFFKKRAEESHHKKLGRQGEKLARTFLQKQGYAVLKKNYVTHQGEIDLIMQDDMTIVFVEVKTRENEDFAPGEEAVNYTKRTRIRDAAHKFIHTNRLGQYPSRYDVVVVVMPDEGDPIIRHQKRAFADQ